MASNTRDAFSGTDPKFNDCDFDEPEDDDVRHSREDAVEARTFELLVETTYRMEQYKGLQARFLLFIAGRLGLRAGEITHFKESWLDRRRSMICIPRHQGCEKGRVRDICGHCRQNAVQKAEIRTEGRYSSYREGLTGQDELEPGGGGAAAAVIPEEELYSSQWSAKTDAAAREIPYDSVARADVVLSRFFDRYDEWPVSQSTIGRRVDTMAEMVDDAHLEDDDLYPHALRSTAATFWADHGLSAHNLKGLFGWSQLSTARNYITESSERTATAMRDATI